MVPSVMVAPSLGIVNGFSIGFVAPRHLSVLPGSLPPDQRRFVAATASRSGRTKGLCWLLLQQHSSCLVNIFFLRSCAFFKLDLVRYGDFRAAQPYNRCIKGIQCLAGG